MSPLECDKIYESPHCKKVDELVGHINTDIAPRFPELAFHAVNWTKEILGITPGVIREARTQKHIDIARFNTEMDWQTEQGSAQSTVLVVAFYGFDTSRITSAAEEIRPSVLNSGGIKIADYGPFSIGTEQALDHAFGHKPEHEDASRFGHYMEYKFE